jgi:hypothetical protein
VRPLHNPCFGSQIILCQTVAVKAQQQMTLPQLSTFVQRSNLGLCGARMQCMLRKQLL